MDNYQRFSGTSMPGFCQLNPGDFPVAMGYVPWQMWNRVYDLERGLDYGTIFPELNKPFCGVRGGCR